MNRNEMRYQAIAALLQAGSPMTIGELVEHCGVDREALLDTLGELVDEGRVVRGAFLSSRPETQYRWRTRWEREVERRAATSRRELLETIGAARPVQESRLDVHSDVAEAFCSYVLQEYQPPIHKRFLVFLQCSVRRPFSTSPSHASMRRAIRVATGYDPRRESEQCPVHVVVLASKIGPVPYELEDVYPANVRGGGVKHLSGAHYARIKPVLAHRMAEYIVRHRGRYERMAAFADGRYCEVMEDARSIAIDTCEKAADFEILPQADGPRVIRMGQSRPRPYWARYWIQLYLEIVSWLEPSAQEQAAARLEALDVQFVG